MPRKKQEPAAAPWSLTQADIDATTNMEFVRGTMRCLPPADIIPDPFWGWGKGKDNAGNIYFHMADCLYTGSELPVGVVTFNEGFVEDGKPLFDFLTAHLRTFEPDIDHKIAGVAYIISQIVTITPEQ